MKKIYLLASAAFIILSDSSMASDDLDPGSRARGLAQGLQPNVLLKDMQVQQLAGRRALDKEVVDIAGAPKADLAIKGALDESGKVMPLHAGIPKNILTGKTAEALVNTLKARAAIFTEIQSRMGKKAKAPAKDYEVQLAENMATLKAQQQKYLKAARESPGAMPQNLQKVMVGFQEMNDALDKQYLDLLSSVK